MKSSILILGLFLFLSSCGDELINENTIGFKAEKKSQNQDVVVRRGVDKIKGKGSVIEKPNGGIKANVDYYKVEKNKSIDINVVDLMQNDRDSIGGELDFLSFGELSDGGQIERLSDEIYRYTPSSDFEGVEKIKYKIAGAKNVEVDGTIEVEVLSVFDDFNTEELDSNFWELNEGNSDRRDQEFANVKITDQKLRFISNNSPMGPILTRFIGEKRTGKIIWSFDFFFSVGNNKEGTYGFAMQLGNKSDFDRSFNHDVTTNDRGVKSTIADFKGTGLNRMYYQKGSAVNLLWGRGSRFFGNQPGGFGYGKTKKIFSKQVKLTNINTVPGGQPSKITVEVDLDKKRYAVIVDGVRTDNIPYYSKNTVIDTMRFVSIYAETERGGKQYLIDNIALKYIP